jgi:hypothetical protein
MSEVTAIGQDLRETRCQLHGVDVSGNMALGASNARYVAEPASIPALLSSVYCATAALEV